MTKQTVSTPRHVAIIMDGNRRWAKQHKLQVLKGHSYVVNTVIEPLVDRCIELGIPYLTLWAFSTENWNRDEQEVKGLLEIFRTAFKKNAEDLHKKGVRLNILGNIDRFPPDIAKQAKEWVNLSKQNTKITVNFALNYGGRDEILRAIHKLAQQGVDVGNLTEEQLSSQLDTAGQPDPDLIIRPGGEKRLSGYLTWQSVYAELYFTDTLMPDFSPAKLDEAIEEFQRRQRRFGK